jgi:hypothetical protein
MTQATLEIEILPAKYNLHDAELAMRDFKPSLKLSVK